MIRRYLIILALTSFVPHAFSRDVSIADLESAARQLNSNLQAHRGVDWELVRAYVEKPDTLWHIFRLPEVEDNPNLPKVQLMDYLRSDMKRRLCGDMKLIRYRAKRNPAYFKFGYEYVDKHNKILGRFTMSPWSACAK